MYRKMQYCWACFLFGLLVGVVRLAADAVAVCDVPPDPPDPPVLPNRLDAWHAWLSVAIATPFDRIDRFFGDESVVDESRRTRLRAGAGVEYNAERGGKMVTDFSLRVALPRMEERWQIFLDELVGEDELHVLSDLARPPVDTDPDIGLRYFFRRSLRTSLSADGGYRFGGSGQAFGRIRGRVRYPRKHWSLDLTQTFTYYTRDGWRSQSDMDWTLPFLRAYGLRSFSRVTWREREPGFAPEQRISLYRSLTQRRAWRVQARGIWQEMPDPQDVRYTLTFVYRQLLHRNWLFVELAPGVEYAAKYDYDPNPFVTLEFEVVFNAD